MHAMRFSGLIAKRWSVLGGVLLAAAAGGVLWWTARYVFAPLPPEPTYVGLVTPPFSVDSQGFVVRPTPVYEVHPLSYWLTRRYRFPNGLGVSGVSSGPPPDPLPTSLLSDSNAVPFLIRALRREGWVGQAYYRNRLWPKLPPRIKAHLPTPPADNWHLRQNAAGLLGQMGTLAMPSIPALTRALKEDESIDVRVTAEIALGYLGRGDKAAEAALKVGFQDTNSELRFVVTNALISIDQATAAKTLRDTTNWVVRRVATRAMIAMNFQAAIDALKGSEDEDIRKLAAETLGTVGTGNAVAVAALAEALGDRDLSVRKAATNSLLQLDPEAAAKAREQMPPLPP
jgi:hypothetical protein